MTHVTYKERSELRKTTLDFVSQPLEYFLNLLQNNTIYTIDSSTLLSKIYSENLQCEDTEIFWSKRH